MESECINGTIGTRIVKSYKRKTKVCAYISYCSVNVYISVIITVKVSINVKLIDLTPANGFVDELPVLRYIPLGYKSINSSSVRQVMDVALCSFV